MEFVIDVLTPEGESSLLYNTSEHSLSWEDGSPILPTKMFIPNEKKFKKFCISLGLSCNYSCDYCLQAHEKLKRITEEDLDILYKEIDKEDLPNLRLEFWGGEPLLYVDAIRKIVDRYSGKVGEFLMITNGSLLTIEFIDYFMENGGNIAVSHDGMSQDKRGKDPIEHNKEALQHLFKNYPTRSSLNSVLSEGNFKSDERFEWFRKHLGIDEISYGGEGFVVDYKNEILEIEDLKEKLYQDLKFGEGFINGYFRTKAQGFFRSLNNKTLLSKITTSCGIDKEDNYKVVGAKGNKMTCHNFNYEFKPETIHDRKDCLSCPVVHLCKGGCPAIKTGTKLHENNCKLDFKVNSVILEVLIELLLEDQVKVLRIRRK